jgi:acetyltransferase-like isoleucine patch superfamily enzyme
MKKYIFCIYAKLQPNGIGRRLLIQCHLILLKIFNFTINLLPFSIWKKTLCRLVGINLGLNVTLCSGVRFMSFGKCTIGDRTIVNQDCVLDNRAGLIIGADVSIAMGVKILTQGHCVDSDEFSITGSEVLISDHVCLFADAMIMPGVVLGRGCVVYPRSVVTNSFSYLSIVAGSPATFKRKRLCSLTYKLNSNFWFN